MVRALGINVTAVFAVTFFVGAFLAGIGGVMGASFAGAATGSDGNWLLNSLVVVIIGGLGSLKGAVAGSLLYGMVVAFGPSYLPSSSTFYAVIFTFALLALVLAVRPYGLFGRPA
jgi:branched-chain amino acid transport system permease protein